jgi:hypothetical protein
MYDYQLRGREHLIAFRGDAGELAARLCEGAT